MISVTDALQAVVSAVAPLPVERELLCESLGLVLAEDVISDIDSPPFDKSLMDGFAIRAEDVVSGSGEFSILECVTAGQVPRHTVASGTAVQIMTGAPLPVGATAVLKIEDVTVDGQRLVYSGRPVQPEANLIRRGSVLKQGLPVLSAGSLLTPARIGALAEFGCDQVPVRRRPRVAILATGDELVPVGTVPGPGQIRNSNEAMLAAQIQNAGGIPVPLGIARDRQEELAAKVQAGLQCDVLILSGGVSAGQLDLVPAALREAEVAESFHKVFMKPGKPVWFGQRQAGPESTGCVVFGLPGNPVSSMVCFELFVRTALRRLMGRLPGTPVTVPARLANDVSHRSDRPTYYPARLTVAAGGSCVQLLPWQGSSDLQGTVHANGMAVLEAGEQRYASGDELSVISWNSGLDGV